MDSRPIFNKQQLQETGDISHVYVAESVAQKEVVHMALRASRQIQVVHMVLRASHQIQVVHLNGRSVNSSACCNKNRRKKRL